MRQLELAERLLELTAHAVERCVRIGGDHRADELEREPDRTGFEWSQPWRQSEGVAVQLLVDPDPVVLQLRIDGVAPAPEVDEIEEL